VFFPTQTDVQSLRDEVRDALALFVTGEWGELKRFISATQYPKESFLITLTGAIRAVPIAVIPILGLEVTERLGFALPHKPVLYLAAIAWICLTLLVEFDPSLSQKVDLLKGLFRLSPKDPD